MVFCVPHVMVQCTAGSSSEHLVMVQHTAGVGLLAASCKSRMVAPVILAKRNHFSYDFAVGRQPLAGQPAAY